MKIRIVSRLSKKSLKLHQQNEIQQVREYVGTMIRNEADLVIQKTPKIEEPQLNIPQRLMMSSVFWKRLSC